MDAYLSRQYLTWTHLDLPSLSAPTTPSCSPLSGSVVLPSPEASLFRSIILKDELRVLR
jgi:hypothetical protein